MVLVCIIVGSEPTQPPTLPFNHCQPIQFNGLWKLCLLSWRLQPPFDSRKKSFPASKCKQESTECLLLISHLDMFHWTRHQPTMSILGHLLFMLVFSCSLHVHVNAAINDSAGSDARLKACVAHQKAYARVFLISQVLSEHKNCWIMKQHLTTGSRSTRWTVAWCRSLPLWRSSSKCRMSTTTRRRPQNPSTTPLSWRTLPKTCQSSR